MTYHLHCHLEPAERKWRQLGYWREKSSEPASFFARHSLKGEIPQTSHDDLSAFLYELHDEQARQGARYVELRLSPRRFLADGYTWQEILSVANRAITAMQEPEVRLILLVNRDSPEVFVREVEATIEAGMPPAFVGMDLAGDELRFPDVRPFVRCFGIAKSSGLGITVHAGEFGSENSIWAALDELGAQRIGHGLSSIRSHSLLRRLSADNILLEVSITSNLATGAISDINDHPLPALMEFGIPVSLNTDVPIYSGASLGDEHRLAHILLKDMSKWSEEIDKFAVKYSFRK